MSQAQTVNIDGKPFCETVDLREAGPPVRDVVSNVPQLEKEFSLTPIPSTHGGWETDVRDQVSFSPHHIRLQNHLAKAYLELLRRQRRTRWCKREISECGDNILQEIVV